MEDLQKKEMIPITLTNGKKISVDKSPEACEAFAHPSSEFKPRNGDILQKGIKKPMRVLGVGPLPSNTYEWNRTKALYLCYKDDQENRAFWLPSGLKGYRLIERIRKSSIQAVVAEG